MKPNNDIDAHLPREREGKTLEGSEQDTENPLPLRALLARPVVASVANYGMIALLEMAAGTPIPLVWSMSVELGGLSMSPTSIEL